MFAWVLSCYFGMLSCLQSARSAGKHEGILRRLSMQRNVSDEPQNEMWSLVTEPNWNVSSPLVDVTLEGVNDWLWGSKHSALVQGIYWWGQKLSFTKAKDHLLDTQQWTETSEWKMIKPLHASRTFFASFSFEENRKWKEWKEKERRSVNKAKQYCWSKWPLLRHVLKYFVSHCRDFMSKPQTVECEPWPCFAAVILFVLNDFGIF